MIIIEKNIPIPKRRREQTRGLRPDSEEGKIRAALQKMFFGDSFCYGVPSTVTGAAKRLGLKVRMRKENGTYRFWLVGRDCYQ